MLVVCVGMRTASDGGAEVAQIPEPAEKNQPTFNFGERLFRWIQSSGESIEEVLIPRYVASVGGPTKIRGRGSDSADYCLDRIVCVFSGSSLISCSLHLSK